MRIQLIVIGKTDDKSLSGLVQNYILRLKHYVNFDLIVIPDIKNRKQLSFEQQKTAEAQVLLKNITVADFVILLDERGEMLTSVNFSKLISKKMLSGIKNLIFIVGGPYGFSEEVYKRANYKLSLSKMTFSHQMIRLFFVEQLYRAFTIIKNEPYHHR